MRLNAFSLKDHAGNSFDFAITKKSRSTVGNTLAPLTETGSLLFTNEKNRDTINTEIQNYAARIVGGNRGKVRSMTEKQKADYHRICSVFTVKNLEDIVPEIDRAVTYPSILKQYLAQVETPEEKEKGYRPIALINNNTVFVRRDNTDDIEIAKEYATNALEA